jgi:mannose-6-phosphate isomerase-like protein (cupin superfamily)
MTTHTLNLPFEMLSQEPESFFNLYCEGKLDLKTYKPAGCSRPMMYAKDQIYVVSAGRSEFTCGDSTDSVEPGDVLLVAAGMRHQFGNPTAGFSAWVFYEPESEEDILCEQAA